MSITENVTNKNNIDNKISKQSQMEEEDMELTLHRLLGSDDENDDTNKDWLDTKFLENKQLTLDSILGENSNENHNLFQFNDTQPIKDSNSKDLKRRQSILDPNDLFGDSMDDDSFATTNNNNNNEKSDTNNNVYKDFLSPASLSPSSIDDSSTSSSSNKLIQNNNTSTLTSLEDNFTHGLKLPPIVRAPTPSTTPPPPSTSTSTSASAPVPAPAPASTPVPEQSKIDVVNEAEKQLDTLIKPNFKKSTKKIVVASKYSSTNNNINTSITTNTTNNIKNTIIMPIAKKYLMKIQLLIFPKKYSNTTINNNTSTYKITKSNDLALKNKTKRKLSPVNNSNIPINLNTNDIKPIKYTNEFTMFQITEMKQRMINTNKLMLNFNYLKNGYSKICIELKKSINALRDSEIHRAHLADENEQLKNQLQQMKYQLSQYKLNDTNLPPSQDGTNETLGLF
ncbi:hypothetical protein TBLA_0H00950 [Henningerozyma blattae CBS 6284]|uniref:Uncharacterized protein n=1 Tax=Henningerozyma blattae (strain ATCC 34711 / CBS 6284 / DSM 70876 / NBRC 10599 / NRRL Y-10934 / UCD 77-7) TaxID=1071380 RepID=I2H7N1_HENB6|nr:hypothetical protein TBLA_0H00950 [Tetrapisispora blattae CBS 6284]CCH62383.1 hypothetical protein TBLA_0H00950 [Tetrapisispora blattae CBS 6284]